MKYFYIILSVLFFGCTPNSNEADRTTKDSSKNNEKSNNNNQQLNLTLLLDLSDRINPKKNPDMPEHYERDVAIVKYLSEYFVKEMEKKGTFLSKGKIKVIFSPKPQDPNINIAAERLDVDLSTMDPKQKKEVHDNLTETFTNNISKIYQTTLQENKWLGSDIWRFFKNDVKDYSIDKNPNYRNILVLLTDGYIYHQDSKDRSGNRYAYILPELFDKYKLRNNQNWNSEIDKQDFGLITKRTDLNNLEVLVLEVSPSPTHKDDEDIIKKVLAKWFDEMKVKRYAIFNSDLPEYTKQRINDFLATN